MGRIVPILGAGRRSGGICDCNALTCTGYGTDCFWPLPISLGADLGAVRRAVERERRFRASPRRPTTGSRWRITSLIRHAFKRIAGPFILKPVGMALDTRYGGRLYIPGPILEPVKVVARAGAAR